MSKNLQDVEDIDNILLKLSKLKEIVKDNEEAIAILDEVEEGLKNLDMLTYMVIRKISAQDKFEIAPIVEKMKKDETTRKFFVIASSPWIVNKTLQRVMQGLWILTASISFIMGIYLFFPPYIFFGQGHGNATSTIQKTLLMISENPQLLAAIDPIFKIIGFVMMAIAIASLYQAHLISIASKEVENVR